MMDLAREIENRLENLSKSKQAEILDFIQSLERKEEPIADNNQDGLEESFGRWKGDESPEEIIKNIHESRISSSKYLNF